MRLLLAAFLALTFAASGAEAAKRVALVIGNGAYVHQAPLANPNSTAPPANRGDFRRRKRSSLRIDGLRSPGEAVFGCTVTCWAGPR